jgi:curved DNA-binding protein
MEFKDYYKALGVSRTADQKTVTQAFRRLAREHHPDVSKRRGAEERFKEINEAYQVLGDPEKRSRYDQIYDAYKDGGVAWQDLFGRVAGAPGWSGPGGVTFHVGGPEEFEQIFGRAAAGGFSDFFQQLFGGLGGFGRAAAAREPRPRVEASVEVTLEEAYRGARRQVLLPGGKRIDVEIPRGVRSGQAVRLPGASAGQDVFLRVNVAHHRLFERTEDDLAIEVPLTVSEAALGAEIQVPTPGGKITMKVPPETQTGRRFRLKGLGVPHARGGGYGDLYVRVKVLTPTGLSKRERELLEELQRVRKENPRDGLA